MPNLRIYTVPHRMVRFCLHFEWIALPIGIGGSGGSASWMASHWAASGWLGTVSKAWFAMFAITLLIGIIRPMHRRCGFNRNTIWTKP
jgi:hypothetical protein